MALDVYVMPLWRFKTGDFSAPTNNASGIAPTLLSLSAPPRPPIYLRLLSRLGFIQIDPQKVKTAEELRPEAIEEVNALKEMLSKATGKEIDWPDLGDVEYNKPFQEPGILRAFAAWHDHQQQLPQFLAVSDLNYNEHPVWSLPRPEKQRFPTLVTHSLYNGYLIPVPFDGVLSIEPVPIPGQRELYRHVASTQVVQAELTDLLGFIATLPKGEGTEDEADPVASARRCAEELQHICGLSVEHRLPMIFWG